MKAHIHLPSVSIELDITAQEAATLLPLLGIAGGNAQPRPCQADKPQPPDPQQDAHDPAPSPVTPVQPDYAIPPEPQEREPLGKAIERLKEEKRKQNYHLEKGHPRRGGRPNRPVFIKNDTGDVRYFETVVECALFLDTSKSNVLNAAKNNRPCKGWSVQFDNPQTLLD